MSLPVVWHPTAEQDLFELYDWVADRTDLDTAFRYTSRIEGHCQGLGDFPRRGTPRDHLEPGLRSVTFERRVVIAYRVETDRVLILRLIRTARDIAGQFGGD